MKAFEFTVSSDMVRAVVTGNIQGEVINLGKINFALGDDHSCETEGEIYRTGDGFTIMAVHHEDEKEVYVDLTVVGRQTPDGLVVEIASLLRDGDIEFPFPVTTAFPLTVTATT